MFPYILAVKYFPPISSFSEAELFLLDLSKKIDNFLGNIPLDSIK
jgi:hypothetical protein